MLQLLIIANGDERMKKKVFLFIILLLSFCIKIDGVKALTCEYEMYPFSYYFADGTTFPQAIQMQQNPTAKLKLKYPADKGKNVQVNVTAVFGKNKYDKFYTDTFIGKMKNGKCPTYIGNRGTSLIQYKNSKEFYETIDTLLEQAPEKIDFLEIFRDTPLEGYANGMVFADYPLITPMVLVKKDDKNQTKAAVNTVNHMLTNLNTIAKNNANSMPTYCDKKYLDISTYGFKEFKTFLSYAGRPYAERSSIDLEMKEDCWGYRQKYIAKINNLNTFYNSLKTEANSAVFAEVQKLDGWSSIENHLLLSIEGSKALEIKEEKENATNERTSASADYCYYYCSKSHCTASTDSNYISACTNGCLANQKPLCDKAYDVCKGIQDSKAKDECLKGKLSEYGLNTDYPEKRAEAFVELDKKIKDLEVKLTELQKANKPSLNIEFNTEGYKVSCEDVKFLHVFWVIIRIIVPILVIIFGTVDFFMAVIASDEKKMQTAKKKFPRRLIAAVLLFVSTSLIGIFVGISTDENASDNSLIQCIIEG